MEKITCLDLTKNLTNVLYVNDIIFLKNGIKLHLSNKADQVYTELIFTGYIGSFSYTNESHCFGVVEDFKKKFGEDFCKGKIFFKIENSTYVSKMSQYLTRKINISNFEHYCIFAADEIIDIVTDSGPQVTITKNN